MHVVDVVILAGWVAFWIYWLAASIGVKAGQARWTKFAGIRVGVILVILLLLRVRALKGLITSGAGNRAIRESGIFPEVPMSSCR